MPNFEIVVGEDGVCRSLWTDLIDLREIGECQVQRASNVEFCDATQVWEARLLDGTLVGSHPTRSGAISQEIAYLNARLGL